MTDTLRFVRADTTPHSAAFKARRDDPRISACLVTLDADPQPDRVQVVLVGVADDRGVRLSGGRVGAADGPSKFRDHFFRMPAPPELGPGSVLNAGDLEPAGHTPETHARLAEVVAVLRERFGAARMIVIGGGHDHAYGEVLGLARAVGRVQPAARIAVVNVAAHAGMRPYDAAREEPHAGTAFRRLLLEPAARLSGASLLAWGLQRSANALAHLQFLQHHGAKMQFCDDVSGDERQAGMQLAADLAALGQGHAGMSLSVSLNAFAQAVSPGVSNPSPLGVPVRAVAHAAAALARLELATQLAIYELNPRFDQDGASARLAALLAWSYATGMV